MTLSEVPSIHTAKFMDIHDKKFLDLRFVHANISPVSSLTEALVVSPFTCDMFVVCGACVYVCVPVPTASMWTNQILIAPRGFFLHNEHKTSGNQQSCCLKTLRLFNAIHFADSQIYTQSFFAASDDVVQPFFTAPVVSFVSPTRIRKTGGASQNPCFVFFLVFFIKMQRVIKPKFFYHLPLIFVGFFHECVLDQQTITQPQWE